MIPYLEFWKLQRPPFEAGNDAGFFFESQAHGEALARLRYFAADGGMGMAVLTGEIGAGKTFLLHVLLNSLPTDLFSCVAIFTARGSFEDLLRQINARLRGEDASSAAEDPLAAFHRLVTDRVAARGRHLLVVLDETQFLDSDCLSALKCLTNPFDAGTPPVSILLAGQPELRPRLQALPHVHQRLGLAYHLSYLRREEVEPYIRHRLTVAGAVRPDIFDAGCADILYAFSKGCPRQINRICKLAVDRACMLQQTTIAANMLQLIVADFEQQLGRS